MKSGISHIGIAGEGKMGTNLFYYLLEFDFRITWLCSSEADMEKITKAFSKKMKRSFEAGIMDEEKRTAIVERTVITKSPDQLGQCDLVIEAITEKADEKQQLFSVLEKATSLHCILASNSSSLNPSFLAGSPAGLKRTIGLHFFYPVALKNIVELIVPEEIPVKVVKKMQVFLKEIKKEPLLLMEENSFILNRIYLDFQNEAFLLAAKENLSYGQMDAIIRENLFPTGAFDFCDSVGNDVMLASVLNYTRDCPDRDHYLGFTEKLTQLVNEGKLGNKTGSGFYDSMAEGALSGLTQDETMVNKIARELKIAISDSIRKFSARSGIATDILGSAMKDYLDSEADLV